jgi:hypothetical protein
VVKNKIKHQMNYNQLKIKRNLWRLPTTTTRFKSKKARLKPQPKQRVKTTT